MGGSLQVLGNLLMRRSVFASLWLWGGEVQWGLPEGPLADHPWPQAAAGHSCPVEGLEMLPGSRSTGAPGPAVPLWVWWMQPSAQGWDHPHSSAPGWSSAGLGSPWGDNPGMQRLQCGCSHSSRNLQALCFFIFNMRVATVSPDYLI